MSLTYLKDTVNDNIKLSAWVAYDMFRIHDLVSNINIFYNINFKNCTNNTRVINILRVYSINRLKQNSLPVKFNIWANQTKHFLNYLLLQLKFVYFHIQTGNFQLLFFLKKNVLTIKLKKLNNVRFNDLQSSSFIF